MAESVPHDASLGQPVQLIAIEMPWTWGKLFRKGPAGRSLRRRHPLECKFLESVARLRDVDIAFRVGGDVMAAADLARNLDRPSDLERLAIDDGDLLAVSDVQELLVRVRGQGQVPRELRVGPDQLFHELPIGR